MEISLKKVVIVLSVIALFILWFFSFYSDRYQGDLLKPVTAKKVGQLRFLEYKESVVRISNLGCGRLNVGSGFFIEPNLIVTNRHVLNPAGSVEIADSYGIPIPIKTITISKIKDLAFVETNRDYQTIPIGQVATPKTEVGVIGYPGGGIVRSQKGPILGYFKEDESLFLIKTKIAPGNSGGPVIEKGRAVGIVNQSFNQMAVAIAAIEISRSTRDRLYRPRRCL